MKLGSTLTLLGVVVKWSSARVTNPETRESVSLATSTSSSIQQRDVLSDLLNDAKNLTTCSACESLLVVLQGLAHLGNKDFVNVITSFCQDLVRRDLGDVKGIFSISFFIKGLTDWKNPYSMLRIPMFGKPSWNDLYADGI